MSERINRPERSGASTLEASPGVARRSVLRGLATAIAGAVVLPEETALRAQHEHGTSASAPQAAAQASQPSGFLDEHELATLTRLSEQLVPGSAAADVPDVIDRLVAVETAETQREFLNALAAFEAEARSRYAKSWLGLTEAEQIETLGAMSKLEPAVPPAPPWSRGQPVMGSQARPAAPPSATPRDHFDYLRGLVGRVYYATEPGMKELGWTGNVFWDRVPGCEHGDSHKA
jgi:hypothetical protein